MKLLDKISIYQLVISFLILLLLLGIFSFGWQKVLWQSLPAVLGASLAGGIFDYLETKRWQIPKTPFISGLIIALVGSFETPQTLFLIGVAAMAIKFFIKWDGRHIFNPAASGLLIGMLVFNSYPSWWVGGVNWWIFLIWIPLLLYKMKRWAPMVGFLLPVAIFSGFNILTSGPLLFFTSVMLIEPKTSPFEVKNGLIYGLIAGGCYILFSQTRFDPLILSLLVANLGARLFKKVIV